MPKKVSVVLPTFNERDNIEKFISDVLNQQKDLPGWEIHLVIADDVRSNDGTFEIARDMAEKNKYIHAIKVDPGLGVALIKGHQYALEHIKPDVLAQLDADGQVDVIVLPKLVKAIEEGYNLTLGSRFVEGGVNRLSLSRRIFSAGASWFVRVVMGPWKIKEVTNSARAFTPELFRKINLHRLPWREKTFIVQPAFLHEAILAGAKYKEVPLIFKNRAEGYSKNKTINYTYDVITYSIDARLNDWGFNVPFFKATRRAKTLIKFGIVGFSGTAVDFFFYKLFIWYWALTPAWSKGISTETAIINNFILNNVWTFRHRKTTDNLWVRFIKFNGVSLIGLMIAVLIVKVMHDFFGDGFVDVGFRKIAYNNFYFFATIPPVMIWNFIANHLFTWKESD